MAYTREELRAKLIESAAEIRQRERQMSRTWANAKRERRRRAIVHTSDLVCRRAFCR